MPAPPDPVGVGLVGYGLAAVSLHAPLLTAEPALRLRGVVAPDPAEVHRDLPGMRVVPTLAALLDDPGVELVVVAAPNAVHHDLAAAALRAGRHVVVDKPMTVTTTEADRLLALAARADRRLAVFAQRRWDSDFRTLVRCVQAGLLGRLTTYLARYDRFRPQPGEGWRDRPGPGAGLLHDLGPHLVDQALHLLGLPATVTADVGVQRPGGVVDDYVHLVLGYGPLRAILHAGSLVRPHGPRLEVHGDTGSFRSRGLDGQVAALRAGMRPGEPGWGRDGGTAELTTATGTRPVPRLPGAYETFYRQMATAVRGGGRVPVSGAEGRDVVRVLDAARCSSVEGRTVPVAGA